MTPAERLRADIAADWSKVQRDMEQLCAIEGKGHQAAIERLVFGRTLAAHLSGMVGRVAEWAKEETVIT